jgi:hypothetical protein
MNEMRIELTARAGCWGHSVFVDGELVASRHHHCFTNPEKALSQALEDMHRVRYALREEVAQ